MAVCRIDRTLDYTVISNHHLKDTALSLKAKGLLSMMLSLPDEWNYTTRGLAAICKEGVDAIGGALRELEKAGYIVRRQLRGPGGRISDTEYTIYEKPCPGAEEPPEEPGPDTTPPDTGAPDTAFPYLVEPDMVEPSTEKPAELNTKRSNIQKSNTHLSNTHSFVLSTPELEGMKDVYEKREEIREQIEYDLICTPVNRTQVDEFVELMLEVAMTRSPTIKIGRDAEYPTAFVQQRFEQITSSHIEKVLDGITGGSVSAADLLRIASWGWLAGLATILLYSLFCWLRLRRTVHMAVRLQDNVYECGNISSPFVLGLFRPRIYLPFRLSEREREYIIRHEEFHIRRKDVYVKALAFFLAAVYWFHPFVWLAFFCMGRDMEMSCDEHVLVEMGSGIKKEYSLSLLSFASNRRLHPAGPLSFGEKDAKSRVKNILGFRKPGVWAAVGGTLMILVIAAVCLTNGTGGADGAGTDRAEINGTEINSAGRNGTEETAGTPATAGTGNRTEAGQPEASMSQEGSREDTVLPEY